MENTLIQKLETDAQKRSISGEVVGLKALFLSQKEQIEEALSSGWKRSEVWAILKENGNYPGTYSAFLKHCSRFISPAPKGHFNPQKNASKKKRRQLRKTRKTRPRHRHPKRIRRIRIRQEKDHTIPATTTSLPSLVTSMRKSHSFKEHPPCRMSTFF